MSHGSSGQIIALFALAIMAMVGVLGLIIDGGNIYVQRRTAQNAADAAALAGTRELIQPSTTSPDTTVAVAVCKYLTANAFGNTPTGKATFVAMDGTWVADIFTNGAALDCTVPPASTVSTTIPGTAAGVKVDATITFNTYLAGIVGFPRTSTAASSTVQGAAVSSVAANNAPFIICGVNTLLSDNVSHYPILEMTGANMETPSAGGIPKNPAVINPNAFGKSFRIHGITVDNCGDFTFKGLADQTTNGTDNVANMDLTTTPASLKTIGGAGAETTANRVDGFNGCAKNNDGNNCVMLVPIATKTPSGSLKWCVLWAAFLITQDGGSGHYATLLHGYDVGVGPESFNWNFSMQATTSMVSLGATH